jgi:hypothetical protein
VFKLDERYIKAKSEVVYLPLCFQLQKVNCKGFQGVLAMMHCIWGYWVSELCPLHSVLKEHDVLESGSLSVLS